MHRRQLRHKLAKVAREPMVVPRALLGVSWALGAIPLTRRRLRADGVNANCPRAPRVGRGGGSGVLAAIRVLRPTCLERALVMQRFFAAQGIERDVVIGVDKDDSGLSAHAWLSGEELVQGVGFVEIHRIAPPTGSHPDLAEVAAAGRRGPSPDPEQDPDRRSDDVRAAIDLIEDTKPTLG